MSAKHDYDICILGGGSAGLTVAAGTAQLGLKTLVVEREPVLGGDCLHYGCVPSKTLISAARSWRTLDRARELGLPRVERPELDYSLVAERIRATIAAIQPHDSPERFCALGAEVVFGQARLLGDHAVDIGDRRISSRFIVLATGSSPSAPSVPGLDKTPYWTNRDLFSLTSLPESLVVLGGGAIACEMAQAMARFGVRVTLVQRSGRILSKEDGDMALVVEDSLKADGVDVLTGSDVLEAGADGTGCRIRLNRNGAERTVRAERLLVALGRKCNVDGLGLEEAGVRASARGVEVDQRLRTSVKHVFAAGDVIGKHQFTHAAGYEGGIVVANAVFRLPRRTNYRFLPHCTFTDPELASVGLNEKQAKAQGVEYTVWTESFADNDRARTEGRVEGRVKLLLGRRNRPLGVQIVGPHAGELLGEWVTALGGGVKLSAMASAVHAYPTLAEINKRVAGKVYSDKLFSRRVRGILHFLFGYKGRACTPPK